MYLVEAVAPEYVIPCDANPYNFACRVCKAFAHDGFCKHVAAVTHLKEREEKPEGERNQALNLNVLCRTIVQDKTKGAEEEEERHTGASFSPQKKKKQTPKTQRADVRTRFKKGGAHIRAPVMKALTRQDQHVTQLEKREKQRKKKTAATAAAASKPAKTAKPAATIRKTAAAAPKTAKTKAKAKPKAAPPAKAAAKGNKRTQDARASPSRRTGWKAALETPATLPLEPIRGEGSPVRRPQRRIAPATPESDSSGN